MRKRLLTGIAALFIVLGGGLHLTSTPAQAADDCTVQDQIQLVQDVADFCGGSATCHFDGCNAICHCN